MIHSSYCTTGYCATIMVLRLSSCYPFPLPSLPKNTKKMEKTKKKQSKHIPHPLSTDIYTTSVIICKANHAICGKNMDEFEQLAWCVCFIIILLLLFLIILLIVCSVISENATRVLQQTKKHHVNNHYKF